MKLSLIAAVAANGVIGADGTMPWHYPEDLAHFKSTTVGHPVIVGRRTYETIAADVGGPLPERDNIVLTSRPATVPDAVTGVTTPAAALEAARTADADTAYVIGGASVYRQFLPWADELILTELPTTQEGDTVFPPVNWDQWQAVDRDRRETFEIVTYTRTSQQ